jgi:hypothetical protein
VNLRARFREQDPVPGDAASAEARMLALAYAVEAAVEDGRYRSAAEVARMIGVSRARMSQVMKARWNSVAGQEESLAAWTSGPEVGYLGSHQQVPGKA